MIFANPAVLTYIHTYDMMYIMSKIKRITANLPEDLIREATLVTKSGITETLIQGLKMIRRTAAYEKAQSLKGKLNIKLDLDKSRERNNR